MRKYLKRFIPILVLTVALLVISAVSRNVREADAPEPQISMPIVMYHHIQKSSKKLGNYCISPEQLREDFQYIKDHGYTPITSRELLNFMDFGQPLPEKPIMITFDDGYLSNYVYAYDLLREFNLKAVISIIGSQTDKYTEIDDKNATYAYINWETALEMQESGYVEFANHTYDMHTQYPRKGCKRLGGESIDDYTVCLTNDIMTLENKMYEYLGKRSAIFTYPFGAVSDCCPDIIRGLGFRITLGCEEGMNRLSQNPDCLYGLKRYNRAHRYSTEDFFNTVFAGKRLK